MTAAVQATLRLLALINFQPPFMNNNMRNIIVVLLGLGGLIATQAMAYTNTSPLTNAFRYGYGDQTLSMLDPTKSVPLENGRAFILGYQATLGTTNNVDNTNIAEENASYIRLSPYVGLSQEYRDHIFWANVKASTASYSSGDDDSYTDSNAQLAAQFNRNGKHRFELDVRQGRGHEAFAVERSGGALASKDTPHDRYDESTFAGQYILGSKKARLRLSFWGELADRQYDTNTAQTRFYDRQTTTFGFMARYQISPKTQFVGGIDTADWQYDETQGATADRDFIENRIFAGLRWFATAKTSGEIRLGAYDRDYSAAQFAGGDRVFWKLLLDYRPLQHDRIRFLTGRHTKASRFDDVAAVIYTDYGIYWQHAWPERIETRLGVGYREAEFIATGANREDDIVRYVAGIKYGLGEKSSIGLGYAYLERDSNAAQFDFGVEGFELTLEAHF